MPSGSRRTRKKRAARRQGAASPRAASSPAAQTAGDEAADPLAAQEAEKPIRKSRRPEAEGAPLPPWGRFPLVELAVLAGIILLVVGFFFASGDSQAILIAAGLVLASIAGLEVAVREHVSGYRSHTLILSGVPAVAVLGVLFYIDPSSLPQWARLAIGLAVFAAAAWALTAMFRSRSGGHAFRVRAPRKR